MVLFIIALLLIIGTVLALHILFRRSAPKLTDQQLKEALTKSEKKMKTELSEKVKINKRLAAEEKNAIGQAFASGIDYRWISYHNLHNECLRLATDNINSALNCGSIYGDILELRNDQDKLLGLAALAHPGHNFTYLQYARSMGFKIPFYMRRKAKKEGWGEVVTAKLNLFSTDIMKFHKERFKKIDHWYVMILGVVESAQGQGVGSTLLDCVLALAHQSGHPVYLECHEDNVKFYQKRGFKTIKVLTIKPKEKKSLPKLTEFDFYCMLWDNKKEK
ncbi:gnat family acetyltransferase [Anaeramoeba flamelloides]|uniref:Gnat family acetyltransferase n=1 Tax=Anaeramoeba flamelloides TaxID=1746091 RepID=A0AAV7Z1J8_9EUKA|nr:gnat family acetyltransferase [Anaeramoeba flamelloides]